MFQLYLGLLPNIDTTLDHVYFAWSIFHLCLRVVTIAVATILIHEKGHRPLKAIQKLSSVHYDKEV